MNLISDRLNVFAYEAALAKLRQRTQTALALDTASAAERRAERREGHARRARPATGRRWPTPRTSPSRGASASGTGPSTTPSARRWSRSRAPIRATCSPWPSRRRPRPAGQLPRARQAAQALGAQLKDDIDVAVLAAEIELAAKDAPRRSRRGSAPTASRRARARCSAWPGRSRLAGDAAGAEASARSALEGLAGPRRRPHPDRVAPLADAGPRAGGARPARQGHRRRSGPRPPRATPRSSSVHAARHHPPREVAHERGRAGLRRRGEARSAGGAAR